MVMNYAEKRELENAKSNLFSLAENEKDEEKKVKLLYSFRAVTKVLDKDNNKIEEAL